MREPAYTPASVNRLVAALMVKFGVQEVVLTESELQAVGAYDLAVSQGADPPRLILTIAGPK